MERKNPLGILKLSNFFGLYKMMLAYSSMAARMDQVHVMILSYGRASLGSEVLIMQRIIVIADATVSLLCS